MTEIENSIVPKQAQVGPVTNAVRARREVADLPRMSDDLDAQEQRAPAYGASLAIQDGAHGKAELWALSAEAYRGPVELARRMRQTEFGSGGFPKLRSFSDYLAHLIGEDHGPDGQYASAYTYVLQAIRPFNRNVH